MYDKDYFQEVGTVGYNIRGERSDKIDDTEVGKAKKRWNTLFDKFKLFIEKPLEYEEGRELLHNRFYFACIVKQLKQAIKDIEGRDLTAEQTHRYNLQSVCIPNQRVETILGNTFLISPDIDEKFFEGYDKRRIKREIKRAREEGISSRRFSRKGFSYLISQSTIIWAKKDIQFYDLDGNIVV